jgi:hypothetical protein
MSILSRIEEEIKTDKLPSSESIKYVASITSTDQMKQLCDLLLSLDPALKKTSAYHLFISYIGPPHTYEWPGPDRYLFEFFLSLVLSEDHRYIRLLTKATTGKPYMPSSCDRYLGLKNCDRLMPFFPFRYNEEEISSFFLRFEHMEKEQVYEKFLKKGICADSLRNLNNFLKKNETYLSFDADYLKFYFISVWKSIGDNAKMAESQETLNQIAILFKFYIDDDYRDQDQWTSFYFKISTDSQFLAWLEISGGKNLLSRTDKELLKLFNIRIDEDYLASSSVATPAQAQFDALIKKSLITTIFGKDQKKASISNGFFCLSQHAKSEILTLIMNAVNKKEFNFNAVSDYIGYFDDQPKHLAALLKSSLFTDDLSESMKVKVLEKFYSVGDDPKDAKDRSLWA